MRYFGQSFKDLLQRSFIKEEKVTEINNVAPCGLICGLCKEIHKVCKGCRLGGGDRNCYQFKCCLEKKIAGCWECESFPCSQGYLADEKWKGVITGFAKCVKTVGPDKFHEVVKSKLGNSINYHEYTSISEQNIINMFFD